MVHHNVSIKCNTQLILSLCLSSSRRHLRVCCVGMRPKSHMKKIFHLKTNKVPVIESKKEIFGAVFTSVFFIHNAKSRPPEYRATREQPICNIHSQWDSRRIFFTSFFSFLLLHMKTQQRKIFLGLVSCQLSNAKDDII